LFPAADVLPKVGAALGLPRLFEPAGYPIPVAGMAETGWALGETPGAGMPSPLAPEFAIPLFGIVPDGEESVLGAVFVFAITVAFGASGFCAVAPGATQPPVVDPAGLRPLVE
jgi:hypothetical protein